MGSQMRKIINEIRNANRCANQFGFTAVEFIIGVAVLGVATAAVMQLVSITLPIAKEADRRTSFESVVNQVHSWIQNEDSCRLAFGGPSTLGGAPAAGNFQVTTVVNATFPVPVFNPSDTRAAHVTNMAANTRDSILPFGKFAGSASALTNPFPDWTAPVGAVWIQPLEGKSFTLGAAGAPALNTAAVTILLTPVGNMGNSKTRSSSRKTGYVAGQTWSAQGFSPTLKMSLLLDQNGYMVSCGPVTYNSYNSGTPSMMGPIPSCADGFAPTSVDGTSVKCVRINCNGLGAMTPDPSSKGLVTDHWLNCR